MPFNDPSVRKRLKAFAFTDLFVEDLGWDRKHLTLPVEVAGQTYTLQSHVHKAGLTVFECPPGPGGIIPDYPTRRQIERQVAKSFVEHLIIFTDTARTTQVWQWMKREKDKPLQSREHTCHAGNPGPLVQKLQKLQFTLDEEEQGISIVHATGRIRDAFDVEKVTKKFYEQFRKEHGAFLEGIDGFPAPVKGKDGKKEPHPDLQWYTSLTLNRLMFVYFIQKKRFLDGDPDYLQNRLKTVREKKGKDKFHSFYRLFLLHLFHEGLGKQENERDPELAKLIGNVPYLNGGFFEVHQLERDYPEIDIPDKAFQRLFAFFDTWDWVLDTRAPRDLSEKKERKDEINPDVVGYIFEKYINQKQMGAYYTKEDITGYITQNTVIPFILDAAAKDCAVAFQSDGSVWKLLKDDPDRYIYEPVRRGVVDTQGNVIPLPPEIEAGINEIPKRAGWNKPAPAPFALPTETWREHVARRQRCLDLREKLRKGEIHTVNDLITHNLDIRQFAQDIVTNADGPELLRAIWQPLKSVTILDPTCGSGAFLFAALQLLEPLYAGCLDKMQALLSEAERLNDLKRIARLDDFKKTLDGIAKHANEDYFVLKSIIVNNLYGVDIMEEAVEICRLRLFLKLVSTVTEASQIEPLPDIDFNVRAGNTLVGYATKAQSEDNLNFGGAIDRIDEKAKVMDLNWQKFQAAQTEVGLGAAFVRAMKAAILKPLRELRDELDSLLAVAYGRAGNDKLPAFRKSHQPFHWWIEFYGIMKDGGFDVIVGNPPWIEYSAVKSQYSVRGYVTEKCGNLHGLCTERALSIRSTSGRASFIVQLPLTCSPRMGVVRSMLRRKSDSLHVVSFDDRPGKLFEGLQHCRAVIFMSAGKLEGQAGKLHVTRYIRWNTECRPDLIHGISFLTPDERLTKDLFPKLPSVATEIAFTHAMGADSDELGTLCTPAESDHFVFYQEATGYWVKATLGLPFYAKNGRKSAPAHGRYLYFKKQSYADIACAILNSSLFYSHFITYSDCFHLNDTMVRAFPVPHGSFEDTKLAGLGRRLMESMEANAVRKTINTKDGSKITYAEYYASMSKPLIDDIDEVLGKHFGLTPEMIETIQNFDVKYRLGTSIEDKEE